MYVAGYLAHKCRDLDTSLGGVAPPDDAEPDPSRPELAWTLRLSHGGLTVPSAGWLQLVEQFEVQFCLMHGESGIDHEPGVVRRLLESLRIKYPRLDQRILKKYAVTRTHMRIREIERHRKGLKEPTRNTVRAGYYVKSAK